MRLLGGLYSVQMDIIVGVCTVLSLYFSIVVSDVRDAAVMEEV